MKELLGTLYRFPAIFQQATANPRLQQQMNQKQLFPGRFNRFGALLACTSLGLAALVRGQTPDDFNPGADSYVFTMAIQPDGKILVGGVFTSLGGQARNRVGRLNSDGTLDPTFGPLAGEGAFPYVYSLGVQRDGKILVGGDFTKLGGQARDHIGRLNSNGTLDGSFNPGAGLTVWSLVEQPDGKILVGGEFIRLAGAWRNGIGRLNANGTLDESFNPVASSANWPDVYTLALQPDGRIVAGGAFTKLGGQTRNRIGRLNADGTLDTTFDPGANDPVFCLAVQADGKILVGGSFTNAERATARRHWPS